MKKCNSCRLDKEYSEFNKNKRVDDGYSRTCRECMKLINGKSYLVNKEYVNKKSKEYYEENKTSLIIKQTQYGKDNPEVRRRATAKYELNNRELISSKRRERYKIDLSFRLRIILGNRLNQVLKKSNINKSSDIIELLGCSLDNLKLYLEKQFDSSMSWENHGIYWEVDHIIPCDYFNLTNIEEQKKCFHYSNLQPLEKGLNRRKSNKILSS